MEIKSYYGKAAIAFVVAILWFWASISLDRIPIFPILLFVLAIYYIYLGVKATEKTKNDQLLDEIDDEEWDGEI